MKLFFIAFFCNIIVWDLDVYGIEYYTKPPTKIPRSTIYKPKVIAKTCLLKPDTGPCRGNIDMYYFDPAEMNCSIFQWGGCQGNGNRYDSIRECTDTCLSPPNAAPLRPKWCALRFDYGYCFGAVYRWYYDPMWKVCKETIYSGCGGNRNNFYSQHECEQVCRFANGGHKASTRYNKDGVRKIIIINHPDATTQKTQGTISYNTSSSVRIRTLPVGNQCYTIYENGTKVAFPCAEYRPVVTVTKKRYWG